jgi:hypothetical protein
MGDRPQAKDKDDQDGWEQEEVGGQGFPASAPFATGKEPGAHWSLPFDAKSGANMEGRLKQPAKKDDSLQVFLRQINILPEGPVSFAIEAPPPRGVL